MSPAFWIPLAILAIAFVLSLRKCLQQRRALRNEHQVIDHIRMAHGMRWLQRTRQLPDDVQ